LTFEDDLPWEGQTPIHKFPPGWPSKLHRSSDMRVFLRNELGRFDLVHVHGLWEWPGLYARQEAGRRAIPLVISPRGMIEPWSLRQNSWAKRLAMAAWERKNLHSAAMFHATSQEEAASLRAQGLRQPIAIIPNGIEAPEPMTRIKAEHRTLAFLSRLHPKKGVRELLEAWGSISSRHPAWNLVIAGPDEDGYGREMAQHAALLGLSAPRVQFLGSIHGAQKWNFLASADMFILPSHSENFGNVILEALSQETPVMTTHGTPWASLPEQGCGWWIPLERLEQELDAALALPPDHRANMGRRGRIWALSAFDWGGIADRMAAAYQWLITPSPAPADLEILP
jgi:glycosyltransferase involved in cell wall biosynthesis